MADEEKACIAGIINGEGSIMLIEFHHNQLPSPCISIASTYLELLGCVKSKAFVGIIKRNKNYRVSSSNINLYTPLLLSILGEINMHKLSFN